MNWKSEKLSKMLFIFSIALLIYMPLHVFIVQSASLLTGGLEVWKAAKDVILYVLGPLLLYISYKRGLFQDKTFRTIAILGAIYAVLHGLYLIFDQNDDTYSTIVGSVYNTRLLGYLLLGYLVGSSKNGKKYLKILVTTAVIIATFVSVLGIFQYFLPPDLLTHIGYSLERGVKPLFFIDDKPDLPRIMSTLKDPNSLGAYLILPTLFTVIALLSEKAKKALFIKKFKKSILVFILSVQIIAIFLTFSRGALLGLIISLLVFMVLREREKLIKYVKKYWPVIFGILLLMLPFMYYSSDTYIVQNVVFHADEATVLEDPNELRVSLTQNAVDDVIEDPTGHGPGSAGLVAISNPKGGILTENYYLQIAYEVGWLGIAIFIGILYVIGIRLYKLSSKNLPASILLSAMAGYLFYSLLIHLWSNEAVALQWWLLTGVTLGLSVKIKQTKT